MQLIDINFQSKTASGNWLHFQIDIHLVHTMNQVLRHSIFLNFFID